MHPLEKRVLLPADLKPIQSLQEYKARGGLQGLEKARSMPREEVIALVKKANLRGRGGAGFPTAIKWETVSKAPDPKKFVVCNFAEGEPGTYKDRYYILKNPYQVFEGMLIAGYVVNAHQVIIGTKEKFKRVVPRIQQAVKELEDAGVAPKGYIRIVLGPDDYLFGEEKALLEVIDGRGAMPRQYPPFIVGVGYGPTETNPTVVNNAETMSHLPNILRNGAEWFRSMGTEDTPGTVILTLTGDLKRPGMYEVETGLTVRQMLYDLAGGPIGEHPIKAVFSGVANRVMTPDQFDLKVDFGTLRANGVGLGSAGFMVYDQSRSMVEIAWMFARFLAVSSCGQCVPCNTGTRYIAELLEKIKNGEASKDDIENILAETGRCTSQTRCFLPTQASVLIRSLLDKFAEEFRSQAGQRIKVGQGLLIPKVEYFDDETRQFTFEASPKEFRYPSLV